MDDPIQLRDAPVGNRPAIFYWVVADTAALNALTLAPADVGKVAYQSDSGAVHVLLDDSPATWFTAVSLAALVSALALKANLASPDFTGNPTAPTQAGADNSTKLATTAFVQVALAALVASSPAALDTLNELAAALGNDPNFATTVTNALSLKAPLASPTLTGTPAAPTATPGTNTTQLATTAFVAALGALKQDAHAFLTALAGLATSPLIHTVTFIIDGAGQVVSTGVKGDLVLDYAHSITGVTLLADQSGSVVVDIWRDTYANYPPTVADTITAAAKPTLSSAAKSKDTTLTGWSKDGNAGDSYRFNVDSAATLTRVSVILTLTRR